MYWLVRVASASLNSKAEIKHTYILIFSKSHRTLIYIQFAYTCMFFVHIYKIRPAAFPYFFLILGGQGGGMSVRQYDHTYRSICMSAHWYVSDMHIHTVDRKSRYTYEYNYTHIDAYIHYTFTYACVHAHRPISNTHIHK